MGHAIVPTRLRSNPRLVAAPEREAQVSLLLRHITATIRLQNTALTLSLREQQIMPTPEHGHDSSAHLRNEYKLQRAPPDRPRVPAFEETFGEGHGNGYVFRHVLIPGRHPCLS